MTAIDEECPASHQKLCLFHMDENLMKHGKGLEKGVLAGVTGMFHAAAYAQTEEVGSRLEELNLWFMKLWCGSSAS